MSGPVMCGEERVGATGILWRCVREEHTEPEEADRHVNPAMQPLAQPKDRHHFRAVRKEG